MRPHTVMFGIRAFAGARGTDYRLFERNGRRPNAQRGSQSSWSKWTTLTRALSLHLEDHLAVDADFEVEIIRLAAIPIGAAVT
jgi:hypothetical protein